MPDPKHKAGAGEALGAVWGCFWGGEQPGRLHAPAPTRRWRPGQEEVPGPRRIKGSPGGNAAAGDSELRGLLARC